MASSHRLVLDNNVLISRLLVPASVPGWAVQKGIDTGQILISDAMLDGLLTVLSRPKFDPYVTVRDRQQFVRLLGRVAERVPMVYTVDACCDSKDNTILEVAVNGAAQLIVTGDRDLLSIGTYHAIPIITQSADLEWSGS